MNRKLAAGLATASFLLVLVPGWFAPAHVRSLDAEPYAGPTTLPPFGADGSGQPLVDYAMQGAQVVAMPSLLAGILVVLLGVFGGLVACSGSQRLEALVQALGELLGALPRMVVVLVIALLMPKDDRSLYPIAFAWALLSAPGAMDEAAAVASRLGGARFVEALRAHGFTRARIYLVHIIGYNLRPVVVRQGAETLMQVVFLEIALSYLAVQDNQSSLTHMDDLKSWADLLYLGYQRFLDIPTGHSLALGLGLIGLVAGMTLLIGQAVRAR